MRLLLLASLALLTLSGCTTVQTNSFSSAPDVSDMGRPGQMDPQGQIQVLYAEPPRDYDSLGTFSVKKYKPGWSDPTVSDAIPELRAAAQLGGQAVIIRST